MKSTKIFALILVVAMCFTMLASCGLFNKCKNHVDANDDNKCDNCGKDFSDGAEGGEGGVAVNPYKQAEYNTFTSVMPSNWNELTYSDNNDTQIMSYIGSSFFEYDYKFDGNKFNEDGTINADAIVPGAFTTNYSAATKLEDVTSIVADKWGYTAEQKAEGGYAWKITLRDDLKWNDGSSIDAADFVYSMKQQLDPKFMNFRGNLYYDNLQIKNSKNYFFQDQEATYPTIASKGYKSNADAVEAGADIHVDAWTFWGSKGYLDENGNTCPQWLSIKDETVYSGTYIDDNGVEQPDACSGKDLWDYYFNPVNGAYAAYVEVGGSYAGWLGIKVVNEIRFVDWNDVGIYSEGNAIVLCLDKSYSFLAEDGSLSLWAAYYLSSLPLVKEDLYESCKKQPVEGATLWTSNYNSSLATTASWGPYTLVEFEAGSDYRLEKNPHWYGWNMEENKNQYNITAINCRKIDDFTTRWLGFRNGTLDDASLEPENYDQYKDSKYILYAPGDGTYGMQLYSNLDVLVESENNNGILAIQEFRHALSLGLNRSDVIENIWPGTATPCLGVMSNMYFYDVEHAAELADGGVFRNTDEAKAGLLRAYGYTEENGKWSSGTLTDLSLEEAYETLTGYNPTVAKEKMAKAIEILLNDSDKYGYDDTKDITIIYGAADSDPKHEKRCKYLQAVIDSLIEGTVLEGKIKLKVDSSAGSQWAEAFRAGKTQIGFGYGFSGNAFDPFDIVGAFVNPDDDLNYHAYWDTSSIPMTFTMPEGDYDGAGQTITMSIQNWYFCLNGLAESEKQTHKYNWDEGKAPTNVRLQILAALEEITLKECRSIMLISDAGGSFLGAKFSYISEDYNTFLGFGGIRYMVVNYNDAEWADFVKANNGDLSNEYMKSE